MSNENKMNTNIKQSLNRSNHFLSASLWMIAYTIMSVANDTLTKFLTFNISSAQIVFLRFFFGCIFLLFALLFYKESVKSKFWVLHGIRGLLLYLGMLFYTYSLKILPLSINIVGCFTIPIFVSLFAYLFLKEKCDTSMKYTIVGFLGVIISFYPYLFIQNLEILYLLAAVSLFASLDIMNKKLLNSNEPTLLIMFYTALFSTMMSAPVAMYSWACIDMMTLLKCALLGLGGNAVFYCLLQSFSKAPIVYVQPFKYIELPLSFAAGILLFHESINLYIISGCLIICWSTLHNFYVQNKKKDLP